MASGTSRRGRVRLRVNVWDRRHRWFARKRRDSPVTWRSGCGIAVRTAKGCGAKHGVAFAHRRLAIQDLSEAATNRCCSTPRCLPTTAKSTTIERLRAALPGPWQSTGDTEVLVHLLAAEGSAGLERFGRDVRVRRYGTRVKQRLLLVRDRLGIKPLYYQVLPDGIAFASELKALLILGQARDRSQRRARFLVPRLHSRAQNHLPRHCEAAGRPHSDLAGGSHYHRALLESIDRHRRARGRRDACMELDALLREVVPAHTLSDVPVGVFLSGGIDSALTAYYLDAPRTYTLGFDAGARSEAEAARRAATHLRTEHLEMTAPAGGFCRSARAHAGAIR